MLPARFLSFIGCEARSYAYLFISYLHLLGIPHRQTRQIIIDFLNGITGMKLRETNSSATNVNTFETINLRDLPDILCQTFVHSSYPGTGQTEGTIQYIHLSPLLSKIYTTALALYFVFNIFSIYDSQRLCQYRVVLCLLYTSPSPRDRSLSRMPSSA